MLWVERSSFLMCLPAESLSSRLRLKPGTCWILYTAMSNDNPYQSPHASTGRAAVDGDLHLTRPPYLWTVLLLFIGSCFLLLLNGQVFTTSLVFLGFISISSVLWLPRVLRAKHKDHQRLAFYVLLGHAIVMIVFAVGMPDKYRRQQEFNSKVDEMRERARQPWKNQ